MKEKNFEFKFIVLDIVKVLMLAVILCFIVNVYSDTYTECDASAEDIGTSMIAETDGLIVADTTPAGILEVKKVFGLNAEDYGDFVYYRSESNMAVEELLIIKAVSEDQVDDIKKGVEKRIDSQKSVFEGYAPEQYAMLNDAKVITNGKFVFYIVSEDSEKYSSLFIKSLKRSH